jgi:hypothetical protein
MWEILMGNLCEIYGIYIWKHIQIICPEIDGTSVNSSG